MKTGPVGDCLAVSPVVGMVLVLAISVSGIAMIVSWGMPAIGEMQANVELRSSVKQFEGLDGQLRLLTGTASKTTPRWQPSFRSGTLSVASNDHRWVATLDVKSGYNMSLSSVGDRDNFVRFTNKAAFPIDQFIFKAYELSGSAESALVVSSTSTCATPTRPGPYSLAAGASGTAYLCKSSQPYNLQNAAARLDFLNHSIAADQGNVTSRAFVVDTGAIKFKTGGGFVPKEVYSNNGALLYGAQGKNLTIGNTPLTPPPRSFTSASGTTVWSLFVRIIQFNGTADYSGGRTPSILLNLYDTSKRADETNVSGGVRVTIYGGLRDSWYSYLLEPTHNYRFSKVEETISGESLVSLYQKETTTFEVKIVHSVVTIFGN
ncbi:MAG: DUF7289 family protein [Methanobacteriota archaeon]